MGIKRLFNALRENFRTDHSLAEFRGKKFGIDGMGWLYQAFHSLNEEPDKIQMPLIRKMEGKFKLLQSNGIDFVVVIDGRRLPGKQLALDRRREKRKQYKETAAAMEEEGLDYENYEKFSQEVTLRLVFFFIDYLKYKGFEYIVAPYEADAQLVYMYKKRYIDYIAGEDSDFIAMSCFDLIRGIKHDGKCTVLDTTLAPIRTDDKASTEPSSAVETTTPLKRKTYNWERFHALSEKRRLMLCIMTGCDYRDNLQGVGFASLLRFYYDNRKMDDTAFYSLMRATLLQKHRDISAEYIENCESMLKSFTKQLIYDPVTKKITNMGKMNNETSDITTYTGIVFTTDANQTAFVEGALDFDTLNLRAREEYDYERAILFLGQTSKDHLGGMSNLCAATFTYAGFMGMDKISVEPLEAIERVEVKKNGQRSLSTRPARSYAPEKGACSASQKVYARSCSRKPQERSCSRKPQERSCSKKVQERSRSRGTLRNKSCDRTTRVSYRNTSVSCFSREKMSIKRCKAN